MNTRFVETFVLLARVGNVRRVAEQMHATPSTISMRMRALEEELGVPLFNWDTKRMQLSAQGAQLLRHAEALLEAERTFRHIAQSNVSLTGRVRVGVIETVVHTCLPDCMKMVAKHLPQVEMDLRVDLTAALLDKLMRQELDLVLCVSGPSTSAYTRSEDVIELPIHWLARKGLVPQKNPLERLFKQQILTVMRTSVPYEAWSGLVHELAVQQRLLSSDLRMGDSPTIAALVALVKEGVAVGLMPGALMRESLANKEVVELQLPRPETYRLAVVSLKNATPTVEKTVEQFKVGAANYCRKVGERWARSTL